MQAVDGLATNSDVRQRKPDLVRTSVVTLVTKSDLRLKMGEPNQSFAL